jgi:hypothetical protein
LPRPLFWFLQWCLVQGQQCILLAYAEMLWKWDWGQRFRTTRWVFGTLTSLS